jgi:hypothetical protein
MTNRETLIALGSSVVSGFIVWLIQQTYLNRRERKKETEQLTIRARNPEKVISDDIFNHLGPGNSIDLMKEMLGVPQKYRRVDISVFSENELKTHSYLYSYKNAYIKATSKEDVRKVRLTIPLEGHRVKANRV